MKQNSKKTRNFQTTLNQKNNSMSSMTSKEQMIIAESTIDKKKDSPHPFLGKNKDVGASATSNTNTNFKKTTQKHTNKSPLQRHKEQRNTHNRSGRPKNLSSAIKKYPRSPCDRFIPNRAAMDMEEASARLLDDVDVENRDGSAKKSEYRKLFEAVLGNEMQGNRIIPTQSSLEKTPQQSIAEAFVKAEKAIASKSTQYATVSRRISSTAVRILDAPDMSNDYYLNLLSWSALNSMAIALGPSVFLWNGASGSVDELLSLQDAYVSSVEWSAGGESLAVGTSKAEVHLFDAETLHCIRTMSGHSGRITSLAWNDHMLTTGSKDCKIINHDVRVQSHVVSTFAEHTQEVCGLKWDPTGELLASGGNDNMLCIWDIKASRGGTRQHARISKKDHKAAVKALSWSPHERSLLASGGGTADGCIKFWNAQTGTMLNSIDTGSQVCSLLWSPHRKEILSSHGYTKNELCLWKYPTMKKIKEFTGHTSRVLHMARSPSGTQVVSAGADETLRFWDIFGDAPEASIEKRCQLSSGGLKHSPIR